MLVYRITKRKYSDELLSSGLSNRWNKEGEDVIYAAQTRSLACLENVVHRSGIMRFETYCVVIIDVPDDLLIEEIKLFDLPDGWNLDQNKTCQDLGSSWYGSSKSAVLKVPSAVIPEEFNYVINTRHQEYKKIKIFKVVPFYFDQRLFI